MQCKQKVFFFFESNNFSAVSFLCSRVNRQWKNAFWGCFSNKHFMAILRISKAQFCFLRVHNNSSALFILFNVLLGLRIGEQQQRQNKADNCVIDGFLRAFAQFHGQSLEVQLVEQQERGQEADKQHQQDLLRASGNCGRIFCYQTALCIGRLSRLACLARVY